MNEDIGTRVRKLREEAGLSRDQLARITGLTVAAIQRQEVGTRKGIYRSTAEAYAEVFSRELGRTITPEYILYGAMPTPEDDAPVEERIEAVLRGTVTKREDIEMIKRMVRMFEKEQS